MRYGRLPTKLSISCAIFREYAGRIVVTLDGEEVRDCVAFDTEAGSVTVNLRDEAGNCYLVDDELARETRSGKVEVRWK